MKKIFSPVFIIFVVVTLLISAARFAQLALSAIDFTTGIYNSYNFYSLKNGSLILSPYILILLLVIFNICVGIFETRRKNSFFGKAVGNHSHGRIFICSALFFITGLSVTYEFLVSFYGLGTHFIKFIGAAGFFLVCFSLYFGNKRRFKSRVPLSAGFFCVIPAVYHCLDAAQRLLTSYMLSKTSDLLIIYLTDLSAILFFLSLGKVFARGRSKTLRIRLAVLGYATAAMIFSEVAAKIVFAITAKNPLKNFLLSGNAVFMVPGVGAISEGIAIVYLLYMLSATKNYKKSINNMTR